MTDINHAEHVLRRELEALRKVEIERAQSYQADLAVCRRQVLEITHALERLAGATGGKAQAVRVGGFAQIVTTQEPMRVVSASAGAEYAWLEDDVGHTARYRVEDLEWVSDDVGEAHLRRCAAVKAGEAT